jgi:hypothetical protein
MAMEGKKIHAAWTTAKELEFLEKLGTHSDDFGERELHVIDCLAGYIQGAELREWGGIDKEKCLSFAKERLSKITNVAIHDSSFGG